jgi:hypothetical protein
MSKKTARTLHFHPLIFALYPVLALLAVNLDQVPAQTALRSALIALAASAVLYLALSFILRSAAKAALLTSLGVVLFFSYGHVYQLIEGKSIAGFVYGKHRFLAAAWLVLLLAAAAWILKVLKSPRELNLLLNIISTALILFPLFQIGAFTMRSLPTASTPEKVSPAGGEIQPADPGAQTPDVYYILLDGYSRADILKQLYQLDITPFMEELKSMGFVIPDCAQSNYGITAFSMYAALNMEYLDTHPGAIPLGSDRREVDYQAMRQYLVNSQVRKVFKSYGYQMITFETGFWWLNIDNSDQYIVENNNPLKKYSKEYALSNFEDLFIRTTALRIITEANSAFFGSLTRRVKTPGQQHYEWVQFSLNQLNQIPTIPGKKFVYFHVLAPHDPHVFDQDGNYHDYSNVPNAEAIAYPNEVTYLNKRIVEIVRSLIASSPNPPVIIIQGDHGWDPRYRMQILNAYYLPNGGSKRIYPTITPVNTFRLIFDEYFGANYKLLPDKSFYSMGSDFPQYGIRSTPYQITPVPESCMSGAK